MKPMFIFPNYLKLRIFLFLGAVLILGSANAQTINVATYNIRFDNPNDHGNLWKDRAPHLVNQILFHQMDLVGTQEGLYNQLEVIKSGTGFPYIGVGRDKGGKEGEYSAIFYNPNKFKLLKEDTFWLSETPNNPSKGWDAALNRICTWGKFESIEGDIFYIFNIHYDHIGQQAREKSSELILKQIQQINKEKLPVILVGDFNVTPDNTAYKLILNESDFKDSRTISKGKPIGPQGTFNAFDWNKLPEDIIDHIFVSSKIEVLRHAILTDNYGLKYPSDHFPVFAEIKF
jgi:endonuclease/exonuclease/phosphatase family metal-dependent hydrolase